MRNDAYQYKIPKKWKKHSIFNEKKQNSSCTLLDLEFTTYELVRIYSKFKQFSLCSWIHVVIELYSPCNLSFSLAFWFALLLGFVNISTSTTTFNVMHKLQAFTLFRMEVPAKNKIWITKCANIIWRYNGARIDIYNEKSQLTFFKQFLL